MARYILLRLIQAIPTTLIITIVAFVLIHIVPGGPAVVMLGSRATPKLIAQINRTYGLNKPIFIQYVIWLGHLLHGNLGESYFYRQSVVSLIAVALPRTLAIVGFGVLFAHIISVVLGSVQAYYKNSIFDYITTTITYIFYSMPTYWLAILLISTFAISLHWLPSGGLYNLANPHPGFGSWVAHTTLPVVTIVLVTVAGWGRYMRASMDEALVQDYIRTARAKGLKEISVLFKHGLRNSILPLITLLGFSLPTLFAGALYVEVVFNYPGMGLLFWNAAMQRDYPVILGIIIIGGVLTILGNLLADVLYSVIDPRLRYD